jgi:flavodoxin
MRVLITYNSVHRGNTKKIAEAMASIVDADLIKYDEVDGYNILDYDLIGFGSGIYHGKINKEMIEFLNSLPQVKKRKAFVFITSGQENPKYANAFADQVSEHGFDVIGKFSCKAFDAWGPLKIIGGINKGRPNSTDIKRAQIFIKELMKEIS